MVRSTKNNAQFPAYISIYEIDESFCHLTHTHKRTATRKNTYGNLPLKNIQTLISNCLSPQQQKSSSENLTAPFLNSIEFNRLFYASVFSFKYRFVCLFICRIDYWSTFDMYRMNEKKKLILHQVAVNFLPNYETKRLYDSCNYCGMS